MIRFPMQRTFERAIVGGTDGVLAAFALPSDSRVHGVRGYVMAEGEALLVAQQVTSFAPPSHTVRVHQSHPSSSGLERF